ncbi:hypothetical protein [Donghicola eburneus]|uniref:hypothetical protein n=1 Tax=Donghicola eburneus TaxID=393278 RepID=UPI0008EA4931|nr:hypothetical protein [Donghicola eburneus]SFQ77675.1 hypothetical protein SAMN05421764_1203 [Donghicola eburneus]
MSRKFFDPHYKPDRSPSKYNADKKRDEASAADAAAFVASFLATYRGGEKASRNPEEILRELRIEARRRSLAKHHKSVGPTGIPGTVKIVRGRGRLMPSKGQIPVPQRASQPIKKQVPRATPSHPWLKRHSSLKFLSFSDADLLSTYFSTIAKIESWRAERSGAVDQKRKDVLAEQVQIQLEKRNDLLALIYDRAIGADGIS